MVVTIPPSARILLAGAVDYAGLFPPAALPMDAAVAELQACRQSAERWALGRVVVPATRLDEFGRAARAAGLLPVETGTAIGVTALAGPDLNSARAAIDAFNDTHGAGGARVEAVECRAATAAEISAAAATFGDQVECCVELPLDETLPVLLDAVAAARLLPKIRMGGVEAGAFPGPDQVVDFLLAVTARGLPFKATAGLHHALRGSYRYTYAADSAEGPMYGYLNLLLATALAQDGAPAPDLRAALLESDPAAITLDAHELHWRGHGIPLVRLQRARDHGMRAFGSCSFREPLADLSLLVAP